MVLLKQYHRENCLDLIKHVDFLGGFSLSRPHWNFLYCGRILAYCCFWYPENWLLSILTDKIPSCKIPKVLFLIHMTCECP